MTATSEDYTLATVISAARGRECQTAGSMHLTPRWIVPVTLVGLLVELRYLIKVMEIFITIGTTYRTWICTVVLEGSAPGQEEVLGEL